MNNDRRAYLVQQRSLGLDTPEERAELASMEDLRFRDDGKPGFCFPPPLQGDTYEQRLADFAKRCMFDDREATEAEVAAFVSGKPIRVSTPMDSPPTADVDPADEWNADAPPESPVTDQSPAQPATTPQAATEAPAETPPVRLPPEYELLRMIDADHAEVLWADPSQPRAGKRKIVVSLSKIRKQQRQQAQATMRMKRASGDGGRSISF